MSNLLEKASILTTPTAYNDGKILSVKPEPSLGSELVTNGGFDTDSDWTKQTSWSISGGAANYDFLSDAKYIRQTLLSGGFVAGKVYKINFDITSGTAYMNVSSNGGGLISLNTYSVGSYSIQVTASVNGSDLLIYGRNTSGTAFSIDNVSVKEVIDGDFDFTRNSSATRVNEQGLIEDVGNNLPRINYTNFDYENGVVVPYSGEGSLLLENQSTNLITYSEDFNQYDWFKRFLFITTNSEISPDGAINATLLIENGFRSQHFISHMLTLTGGTSYSVSIYAKKKDRSVLQIVPSSSHIDSSYANYDLDLGVVSATGGSVTAEIEYLSNDWYRCILKFTVTSTATAPLEFFMQASTTALRGEPYQGSFISGIYLWGAQVEALSYATSYTLTNGSTVTRLQDAAFGAGSSDLINSTEGVLYWEGAKLHATSGTQVLGLSDGSAANRIGFQTGTVANRLRFVVDSGGNQASYYHVLSDITDFNKAALKWKQDDFSFWVNGVKVATDTSGNVPPLNTLNTLDFYYPTGIYNFTAKTKCVAVFKEALTDEELTCLTTI